MFFFKVGFQKRLKKYKLANIPHEKSSFPFHLDARFFHELLYLKNEKEIDKFVETKSVNSPVNNTPKNKTAVMY